jgi:hypothetical protein
MHAYRTLISSNGSKQVKHYKELFLFSKPLSSPCYVCIPSIYIIVSHTYWTTFVALFSLFEISDCQSISVRFLARTRYFSHFKSIQIGFGAHPDFYKRGGNISREVERQEW